MCHNGGVDHHSDAGLRAEIVEVGRRLYDRSLVVATDGNISARLGHERILATPSGLCKGRLAPDQLIVVGLDGRRVDRPSPANRHLRPTSELAMHLEAYRQRPDIGAVVHAHPPHAVALSIAGIGLAACTLPEAIVFLGAPPTVPYATPSGPEGAAAVRDAIADHDALVLAHHGSLAVGDRPLTAYHHTETLEQLARITFLVQLLRSPPDTPAAALAPDQIAKLLDTRNGLGLRRDADLGDFCAACGVCHPAGLHATASTAPIDRTDTTDHLQARVRAIVARVLDEMAS